MIYGLRVKALCSAAFGMNATLPEGFRVNPKEIVSELIWHKFEAMGQV
jgi:hypothetical protein